MNANRREAQVSQNCTWSADLLYGSQTREHFPNVDSVLTLTLWKVSVFWVFLVRFLPNSDWIRRDTEYLPVFNTEYLPVFSTNAGKYGPEKLQIWTWTFFTQCLYTFNDWYPQKFHTYLNKSAAERLSCVDCYAGSMNY